ncbi:alpha/beta hydrolase [Anaeromyxobacter oryzae]|uniref:Esterase n=1 Tax=Anaeromyxobacter oryzae TaxID=2918170 RepID=A0ABM7WT82_9BACT|nr:alpha/beta hydrolase-fold protein [Anaeromyxobacter oryzae]BDG02701.1 esterase [Anaeromyxobacter oryzae]
MTPARLVELELDSPALAGNPLGDPSRRPLLVWLPPGHDGATPLPAIYFLHGFSGNVRGWTTAGLFQPSVPERLEALVASGEVPPFVAVFPDGATALGGTQWMDAPAVGRYQSYVAEDVVAVVEEKFPVVRRREARAVVGKSSGGYGALRMGRDRTAVFAHVACHSGDAAFEYCYLPELPVAAAALLSAPDPATWLAGAKRRAREAKLGGGDHPVLNILAMAAHYSPDPHAPLGLALPFDRETARLRPEVWARWLAEDPVRFVPAAIDTYRTLETVFVDCGTHDEYHLRWGARMVVESLRAGGLHPLHEEFEDGHSGTSYRYEASVRAIAPRLARS